MVAAATVEAMAVVVVTTVGWENGCGDGGGGGGDSRGDGGE